MHSNIRLAIAGLGLVGKRHAEAVALVPGVDLVATVDPNEDGRDTAASMGLPCFETIEGVLENAGVDGIILATPTLLHVEQAMACIEHGCPVLVEKPIGASALEAHALVQLAETRNVPLLVGHHRRYNPLIQKAKEAVESGVIGDVRAVQGTCWFYKPDSYFEAAPWRMRSGAGPVSVNLVHDIDLIRYLCGEVTAVQAVSAPSVRGFENEDVASALLEFSNGAVGTISVSDSIVAPWSWEFNSQENPKYPPMAESCYLIGGSEGSLSVPDLRVWTHQDRQQDWWTPLSATTLTRDASDPLVNQISHFKDVILRTAEPIVSGVEGLRTLQVIEAIQVSAQHRNRLEIKDITAAAPGSLRTAG
ncbi:MAG: Gfo/Idh/MocA family oxidoreductase [Roseibium sp.]|uniref:Gfo/Idh/MocA family protein n=1 Tax=Roseibium sp. TaxID=1936156 RepID=UPI002614E592|nr:Gfo/Idh/MocA family oxidoreductase [Roseibium sp.]MCV0425126.1 Gfo/Idh/MocA family oxidoreductase [Roseibium sp.]